MRDACIPAAFCMASPIAIVLPPTPFKVGTLAFVNSANLISITDCLEAFSRKFPPRVSTCPLNISLRPGVCKESFKRTRSLTLATDRVGPGETRKSSRRTSAYLLPVIDTTFSGPTIDQSRRYQGGVRNKLKVSTLQAIRYPWTSSKWCMFAVDQST